MSKNQGYQTAEEAFQAMLAASFGKARKEAYKPTDEKQNKEKKVSTKVAEKPTTEQPKDTKVETEKTDATPIEEVKETPKKEDNTQKDSNDSKPLSTGLDMFFQTKNITDFKILNLESDLADKLSTIAKIEKIKLQELVNNVLEIFFESKRDSLKRLKIGSAFKFSNMSGVEQSELIVPEKIEKEPNWKSVRVSNTMYDNLQVLKIAYKIPVTTFFAFIVEEWLKQYKPILETKSYGVFIY